jgi:simple sugar transport system ATP-binding protein
LYHNADILILDEPTSVLTPNETGPFFELLERLKGADKTIIFITHKLEEVMTVADEVTVMQDGRIKSSMLTQDTDPTSLARMMVGRDVLFQAKRSTRSTGDVILQVKDVTAMNDRGLCALSEISLELRAGEIFGIAGVDGNGQAELAEVITGLRKVESGNILMADRDITNETVAERAGSLGISYVPENRHRDGLVLDDSVSQNMILRTFNKAPFVRYGFFNQQAIAKHAERLTKSFDVRLQSIEQEIRFLSGGNQQRVILARELASNPKVLIAAQPTKGLDVGAIEFVQNQILAQRDEGVAILYISTELERLLDMSDRIGVVFRGSLMGTLPVEDASPEKLGLLMAGVNI